MSLMVRLIFTLLFMFVFYVYTNLYNHMKYDECNILNNLC